MMYTSFSEELQSTVGDA